MKIVRSDGHAKMEVAVKWMDKDTHHDVEVHHVDVGLPGDVESWNEE